MRGSASDIEIEADQIVQMRQRLNRLFAQATGQEYERIARDTERNFWMNAKDACAYGLVHQGLWSEVNVPGAIARTEALLADG